MSIPIINTGNNEHGYALFTHRNPDGDALGSLFALGTWLENQGKTVSYHISTPISKTFDFLEKTKIVQSSFDYTKKDLIVFLDSANPVVMFEQLWLGHEEYFQQAQTLCIDHHVSNTGYAKENIIHPEIGSTCELLANLLETWQPGSLTPEIATYLYLGLSTDTGHFMHATTAETYKIAAKLIECGADSHLITTNIYKSKSLESLAFTAKVISKTQKSGNLLRTWVDYDEITDTAIDREEAKEALYQLQGIKRNGIIAYFELRQTQGHIRCSLRSNNPDIDVSSICAQLDPCGGGHRAAAGCKILLEPNKNPLEQLEDIVGKIDQIMKHSL